ncbi:putative DD41D transposase [Trichonephila clavipes]|nr:putative DD41D transposase [Trichonephila clavipes]
MPYCRKNSYFIAVGKSRMLSGKRSEINPTTPTPERPLYPDRFVEWAQNEIAVVPDFHKRILFSDEAHFWLNGYVNKQNCRIWSEANPQVYVETPLHPEKLTVWCALWAGGIIGPYFFKNDDDHNVTVNGDRYRAMITNFFIPELNTHDVQELWFQQYGATCHTARATIDLLKDTFGDRLISRFGPVNWPPRSCDLTPLDHFLWGYVKSLVYADKQHSPCYCRYTATNVGKSHRKLDVQIGLHPSQPWQSYARDHILNCLGDFWCRRLAAQLGFLVGSLIVGDPNMACHSKARIQPYEISSAILVRY